MKPDVAKFTRDRRADKVDLWNAFVGSNGKLRNVVLIAEVKAVAGANAPRYMEAKGYIHVSRQSSGDYYVLTDDGTQWLQSGLERHLKNHPSDVSRLAVRVETTTKRVRRR